MFGHSLNQPPSQLSLTTSELIKQGGRVAANCQLVDVRPTRLSAELLSRPGAVCEINLDVSPSCRLDNTNLVYETDFTVNITSDGQEVAVLAARFAATFQIFEGFTADQSEYLAFGDVTVFMSMFPYLREYVHTTAARLGLNGVVLGLLHQPAALTLQAKADSPKKTSVKRTITPASSARTREASAKRSKSAN
jgi:preprotein translocase subunit SecB